MKYALVTAIQGDAVFFEAPTPLVAGLTVLLLGWPCTGARPCRNGKPDPTRDIPGQDGNLCRFLSHQGGKPGRALRDNRPAVIAALASMRRDGAPPAGLIDIVDRAHEWAATMRAASAPVSSIKEAAE